MSVLTSKTTGNVALQLTAYRNCDDVQLFWRTAVEGRWEAAVPGCLGFTIERQRRTPDGVWGLTEILRNRVGFSNRAQVPEGGQVGYPTQPSSIWPFQRHDWTDHGANSGHTVRYRVVAVALPDGAVPGAVPLDPIADSGWTEAIPVGPDCGDGVCAYFNRGFVMSQFVARQARLQNWRPGDIKDRICDLEEPLRRFLSGELRVAMLRLLDEVIEDPGLSLYAALYELSDGELIRRLRLLRGRAHVVLANGSKDEADQNAEARQSLNAAGVEVHDRLLRNKGLGHNKFVVVVRTRDRQPLRVWTGSTNWTSTGLCTQVNNGIMLGKEQIVQAYLEQWQRLADAGSDFPDELVEANDQSPRTFGATDVWFTRVRQPANRNAALGADLQALVDLVNGAQHAILYVMFQPGSEPLASIVRRASEVYVRGVVSSVTPSLEEAFSVMGVDRQARDYRTALVQPQGIGPDDFSAWVREVTRGQFMGAIGHAITHAKMIVIDPLSDDCKVITGSHNFSKSASKANDENFVIVRGNKALAEAYAVACLSTYAHYRWRAYVKDQTEAGREVWHRLSDQPRWQERYLTRERKEHLALWCP